MPKVILFDADGVTLKRQGEYFSQRFAREYKAPLDEESITKFFKTEFRACQQGEADLKEALAPKLLAWHWSGDTDSFFEYWFTTDAIPDEEVLNEVQTLRHKGVECYLATDQEKYRAEYILNQLRFKEKFDGFWFSYDLKLSKSQPAFFAEILRRWETRFTLGEIDYWDDDMENIDAAKEVGINAYFYRDLEGFKKHYSL